MNLSSAGTERTLYVSDLDGTLLSADGVLATDHARRLDRLVRDRGLLLTYATARSHLMAARALGAGWGTPAVVYNGAFTVHPGDGAIVRQHFLTADTVHAVLQAARHLGLMPLVFDYGTRDRVRWVSGQETAAVQRYLRDRPADPRFDPCGDWDGFRTAAVFYIAVIGDAPAIAELATRLAGERSRATVNVQRDTYHPMDTWLELTPAGVTKATEVRALADALGATRLVCFGDNSNDLPLFEIADESYAVANAAPHVRSAATGVIGDNTSGSVVEWLEKNAG
ncbi:HAD-IIB family hydrolase [Nocardioides aquiterrae]|uniref:Cof-type HAD-IIB family hydrolase n=1 Tax=Nocardioides aquiterrae TaxID=203799 RepID=A0ABN1UCT5_9ACTN